MDVPSAAVSPFGRREAANSVGTEALAVADRSGSESSEVTESDSDSDSLGSSHGSRESNRNGNADRSNRQDDVGNASREWKTQKSPTRSTSSSSKKRKKKKSRG